MGEHSAIEWTHHTFNPWIGCTKISPACDHCYAEAFVRGRMGKPELWKGERHRTAASTWKQPLAWNRKAGREGVRKRVFCASLADVFDNQVPEEWREDLWELIGTTPALDWLLLTKRPQNILKMLPPGWRDGWPNVWLGTTVENQAEAGRRIPHLLSVSARVHFLSCEPLLGPIDVRQWVHDWGCNCGYGGDETLDHCPNCGWAGHGPTVSFSGGDVPGACPDCNQELSDYYACPECKGTSEDGSGFGPNSGPLLNWIIAGGESGPGARPSHPDWFRSLRDQCAAAGVPFLFKQHGDWVAIRDQGPGYWPTDGGGCIRMMPDGARADGGTAMQRVGKKSSGRLLDGVLHDQFPEAA